MKDQVYRARKPKTSPLWHCLSQYFDAFLNAYEEHYQPRYGGTSLQRLAQYIVYMHGIK